jgi:mono/diheme cytochrome c family protein
MASSGCRARSWKSCFLLGLLGACGACTTTATREPVPAFEAGVDLPEGEGREILVAECLGCHGLSALPLFAGFYTRDSWRTLVVTMKEHGAKVDDAEIELLSDYLAQHFGPATP